MKNKIEDLRNHLFAQLERLGDTEVTDGDGLTREIAKARAISDVAKTIVDSARVEVEYARVRAEAPRGAVKATAFIEGDAHAVLPPAGSKP